MAKRGALPPVVRGQPVRMSFEDFLAWLPHRRQGEWVDGEAIIFMTTSERHVRILRLLVNLLSSFVERFDLGEVFPAPFLMRIRSGGSGREPDAMVLLRDHLDRVQHLWIAGPADIVVEVVSDDSMTRDRRDKFHEYEEAGVPEYLIVDGRDGRQDFEFYRLNDRRRYEAVVPDQDGCYHSEVLPGFWLNPNWLWQIPLPKVSTLMEAILATMERRRSDRNGSDCAGQD